MGRFSTTSRGCTLLVLAASILTLAVVTSRADAARRPPGPAQAAPKPRAVVATARVPFSWHKAKHVQGYDLRVARDRGFRSQMQTLRLRGVKAQLLLQPGRWFWKVRGAGKVNSRWSNIRQVVVRPTGDPYPPTRPTVLRVTAVAENAVTVTFGASKDNRAVVRYELLAGGGKVLARGVTAPITAEGLACATTFVFRVRAFDAAGHVSQESPVARARTRACTDHAAPAAPANVRAITVADTSVALAWDPAVDSDGTVRRYAVYRNGVLLGQPAATGFLARSLAPATPYRFTVAAIDGAGHRSPDSVLDTATQAPLPATGPAYAYMLASTGRSFDDLQRHYRQIAIVSPTYYQLGRDLSIVGQDDPLVTGWARLRGIVVEPRVESQDPGILHTLLSSAANRSSLVVRISELVATHGYDGINIDFEAGAASDRPLLTAFITELAQALHAQGATLTMAIAAKTGPVLTGRAGFYDYPALAAQCDRLFTMAWDFHWAASPAGGISDVTWVTKVVNYIKTVPNASRFIIGTQLYGFDWPLGAHATPLEWDDMTALQTSLGATTQWDAIAQEPFFTYTDTAGVSHTAYYATAQSVQWRLGLARAAGLGVGLWRLGDEDQETWNIPSLNL
jgi:spore germination protein YaaH/chitodextrinase